MSSIQSSSVAPVTAVPLALIHRPIPPVLDPSKITAMVSTLRGSPMASATCTLDEATAGELAPVDVLCVRDRGKEHFFAFGGCHRLQAYEQAGEAMVKCKVLPATKKSLRLYLGGSVDRFFEPSAEGSPSTNLHE